MALVTTSVLTACSVKPEERESRAAEALAKKYHREFEITQVYPQKLGELYYEVQAYPVNEPQVRFTAAVDTEDDRISDTYVVRCVCAAISRRAAENLNEMPGYYYLFTHTIGPQPIVEDAEITIKDYAALDPDNRFRIEAFVVPEEKGAGVFYDSLGKIYSGLEYLDGDVRLFVVDEEQMGSIQAFFDENDDVNFDFLMLTEKFVSYEIPYADGEIRVGRDAFAEMTKGVL